MNMILRRSFVLAVTFICMILFTPLESKAAQPAQLIIPAIKVNSNIKAMGIDRTDGRMAVPNNYRDVGWLKTSAQPGKLGASVMGAHVDNGGKVRGVFKNLKYLKPGHFIYVRDINGKVLKYKVSKLKVYNKNLADTSAVFVANTSRLNLITCHGKWLPRENTYSQRLVVSAELVS